MRTRSALAALLILCDADALAADRECDPYRLSSLYAERHAIEIRMFHLINEAAVRRDARMQKELDLYRDNLGYIPRLAAAHYAYVFGDKSRLDWLLAEDKKRGLGSDSPVLAVFGYMDEWDRTIRRLRQHADFWKRLQEGGEGEMVLEEALNTRKRLYGLDRFQKAWDAAATK